MGNKQDSSQDSDEHKDSSEQPDEAPSAIFKLLETTVRSGFKIIDRTIEGAEKSQTQLTRLLQGILPESLASDMKKTSEQIQEEMKSYYLDFFSQFILISREEFDLLKLDVIKLKAQVEKLKQSNGKESKDESKT